MLRVPIDHYPESVQYYKLDGSVARGHERGGTPLAAEPYDLAYTRLARIGAPVDCLLAEDLDEHPGDYKLYIFGCCTRTTPAFERAVEKLRKRPCTILWTYAPGYAAPDGCGVDGMKRLTGLSFGRYAEPCEPKVTLRDGSTAGVTYNPIAPVFYLTEADERIGTYADGKIGIGSVKTGSARSVFSGPMRVELPLLRTLAREAGVHLYSDSLDPMEANDGFVTLHARSAGRKTIRLPRKADVYDVFNCRMIARDVDTFSFEADLLSSWLFAYRLRPEEKRPVGLPSD